MFLVPEIGKETSSIDTQAVSDLHGDILAISRHFVRAAIPPERLDDAASIQGVRFIQRPIRAQTQQTVTEGASEIKALANQARGVKGQGVKVAVIDPGFAGANMLPEDMPPSWRVKDFTAPNDSIYSGTVVHGTACAEVIYDIAPEGSLYLLKIDDLVDFENAKDLCVQEGIGIVSYSGSWLGTGFGDGTGVACNIVNDAADKGILWVNSAGNYARSQYTDLWADKETNGWGEFGGNDNGDEILEFSDPIPAGDEIEVWLTWNDWPATSQDYDLVLYRIMPDGSVERAADSRNIQKNSAPVEHIEYMVTSSGKFGVAVRNSGGARTQVIKGWSKNHDFQYPTALVGSIGTPADARGAFSVGAIDQRNWDLGTIEPFSSRGPTADGRIKPELVAPDRVSTVSYGRAAFPGTSAAAPHVAGAAALVKSANPNYTRQQLWDALISATVDLGRSGQDTTYGYGKLVLPLLQALPSVAAPVAAFTPSVTAGNVPLMVSFTNQSVGSPTSYGWDFGDGGTSTDANPRHTYTKAGTYTVRLVATNTGGSNQVTWTITVTESPPVAAFTPSVTSGRAPLTISLTNQSTGSPTSYSWDFGDGTTSTLTSPSHTYARAGNYTVQLTATKEGVSSKATRTVSVTASPPVAAFIPSVISGVAPLRVTFTNQSTGNPTSYRWDFGDRGTSTATNPTHTYTSAGRFTVRLTATNAGGSNQASRIIFVTPIDVLPNELSMVETQVGSTSQKTFNVTNGSANNINVTLSLRGQDPSQFSVNPSAALLRAGKSRGFTVGFSPTSAGTKTASVSIGYGSSGAPLSVSLRGQAIAPVVEVPLSVLPTELSMADTRVDSTSQKTFTITNSSSKSVTVTLSVGGSDVSQFRITPGTATLGAGRSRGFTVSFSPTSAGSKTASVSINHNAGGRPLTVALRGQAVQPASTIAGQSVTQNITGTLTTTSKKFADGEGYYDQYPVHLSANQSLVLRLQSTTTIYIAGVWDSQKNGYVSTGKHFPYATQTDTLLILHAGDYSIVVEGLNGALGSYTFAATATPGPLSIGPVSKPVSSEGNAEAKDVSDTAQIQLSTNYPNPFNGSTTLRYVLPETSWMRLEIYDLMGQSVRVLVEEWQEAGDHQVAWDGQDGQGRPVSSGVYLYRILTSGRVEQTRRMLLLR